MSVEWTKESVRVLRLRLGLSLSDMARHLQIDWSEMRGIENGVKRPTYETLSHLELLWHQADSYSVEMSNSLLADCLFSNSDLDQVDFYELPDITSAGKVAK